MRPEARAPRASDARVAFGAGVGAATWAGPPPDPLGPHAAPSRARSARYPRAVMAMGDVATRSVLALLPGRIELGFPRWWYYAVRRDARSAVARRDRRAHHCHDGGARPRGTRSLAARRGGPGSGAVRRRRGSAAGRAGRRATRSARPAQAVLR